MALIAHSIAGPIAQALAAAGFCWPKIEQEPDSDMLEVCPEILGDHLEHHGSVTLVTRAGVHVSLVLTPGPKEPSQ
jgi:hypothetical protein